MLVQVNLDHGTLLDALRKTTIYTNAPCNGRGVCGKCKIKITENVPPATAIETKFFSADEIASGIRLACAVTAPGTYIVELEDAIEKDSFSILSSYEVFEEVAELCYAEGFGVGIDIGTTTIAIELFDLATGELLRTHTFLNTQRSYGSDVISRIDYANKGGMDDLNAKIISSLKEGLATILGNAVLSKAIIAGNTTMLHLLTKADCSGLGIYPFTANFLDMKVGDLSQLLALSGEYTLLAGISTYVGADILSGILHTNMHKNDAICILIDIGTNGEMAIGNKHNILTLATAAGPAFEGGNISCGVGSIAGAICQVASDGHIKTIGDAKAVGICGSGLIDAIAVALANETLDETGSIETEVIHIAEDIYLTQKDIREFQLAKSAIRAGIEVLLVKYGVAASEIDHVYLAGGFGKFINLDNAISIGLLPNDFADKIQKVGNTSLGGVRKFLLYKDIKDEVQQIKSIAKDLNLAHDPLFNELFMEHMLFE